MPSVVQTKKIGVLLWKKDLLLLLNLEKWKLDKKYWKVVSYRLMDYVFDFGVYLSVQEDPEEIWFSHLKV